MEVRYPCAIEGINSGAPKLLLLQGGSDGIHIHYDWMGDLIEVLFQTCADPAEGFDVVIQNGETFFTDPGKELGVHDYPNDAFDEMVAAIQAAVPAPPPAAVAAERSEAEVVATAAEVTA